MSLSLAAMTARRGRPTGKDVCPKAPRHARTPARSVLAPALAALLALSCGRSLMIDGPSPADGGGAGGSAFTGTGASNGGTSTGGNGGRAGVGGNGNKSGTGGTAVIDGGADQRITPQDGSVDRATDATSPTDTGGCPVDCNHLPNVQPNILVSCLQGKCQLTSNICLPGFANCSGNANTGCETDLSSAAHCGACGADCAPGQTCRPLSTGVYFCALPCRAPQPDMCSYLCVDLQTDLNNCGTCGTGCYLPNADSACQAGKCLSLGCSDPGWADCTSEPGCETALGAIDNCGGCGDPVCTLANTLFTCADGGNCGAAVCAPGFANCNTTSADCETSFASPPASGSCLPHYLSTLPIATGVFSNAATAIAPDGSFFLAGAFNGAVDFDPSSSKDVRTSTDDDGYVTKFNADGSYAWTAVFAGRGEIYLSSLAVTPSGGVVTAGSYMDTVDFDPGPGSDVHFTATADQSDLFVVELTPTGTLAWAATFPVNPSDSNGVATGIAVDGTGAVYVSGTFIGTVDFDPGAGTSTLVAAAGTGFVVKLTAGGTFAWVQSFDNGLCDASLASIAIAKDGTVWAAGTASSGDQCTIAPIAGRSPQNDVLIVRLTAGGRTLSVRTIGNQMDGDGFAVAASPDGSMYLGGHGSGETVFDPGPPPVERWMNNSGSASFLLKLDATGALIWVRSVNGTMLNALAATSDGGLLAAGLSDDSGVFVTRLTTAGTSIWSFEIGPSQVTALSVSSAGNNFLVGGTSNGGTVDFDPGPAIDPLFGEITFVSRFTF